LLSQLSLPVLVFVLLEFRTITKSDHEYLLCVFIQKKYALCNHPMSNHHARDPLAGSSQEDRGHDPIRATWREAPDFNKAWLKNGESLRPVQKVGFTIFSVSFLCAAFFFANGCWVIFQEATVANGGLFTGYFFGLSALVFLFLGIAGLRNALRRKPTN
jgi:hypothetical protein